MSSTVRIEEEDKKRLRRLQDRWEKVRGARPSQKEILGRGLAYLEDHQESFLTEAAWTPFTEEEIDRIEEQARNMGEWSARDHDEILYGSGA